MHLNTGPRHPNANPLDLYANTFQSLSSRVLSRSHVQFLLGHDGNLFVADLGSLHGTKIENYGSIGRRSLLQLLDGDVLVLGKAVESKNYNHRPTRIRVNLRYPRPAAVRCKPHVADMASKPKLQDVAQALGLLTAVRRRGYGLDESLLYLSESEDPLPRGESTPSLSKSQRPDDDLLAIDTTSPVVDDDSVVFLAQSTPSKVVDIEAALFVDGTDDTATPPPLVDVPGGFNVSVCGEDADIYDDRDPLDIESVESYPIKFIPSSFPEDDAISVDGSEQQDMVIDHSDDEGLAHVNEDVQHRSDGFFSDDGHDANETFFDSKRTPTHWQSDSEHEPSDEEADPDGELCAKSDGSASNSDYEDDEEGDDSENDSENDSEEDEDNESERASSDEGSVSHAEALDAEAFWPPSHLFSFNVPEVLPEAGADMEQNDTRDIGTSFTDNHSFISSKSAQPSFNPFALASFPPSPPLSTGADGNASDDNHEASMKALGALMAKGLAANARSGTKRAFDEIDTDEAVINNTTIDAGTNPSSVTNPEPAPAPRPSKIARYMRNAGFVAAGMAIGSIGTIAGLLRMAAE